MFGRADFRRMAELLPGIKGRFLLSLNDVPAIREIFAGLTMEEVATTYTIPRSDETARPTSAS